MTGANRDGGATFTGWIRDEALPFWAEAGFDAARGRFHERLDLAGRPLAVPHRMMVQARQIYAFAHADLLGWHPGGACLADRAMATLLRDYAEQDGTILHCTFAIGGDGTRDERRDAYAHAFLLFALAWLYRATGEPEHLARADRLIAFIAADLTDGQGGMIDRPADADRRLQNPTMHLLEAYLAMARAAPERDYLSRARPLVELFRRRLFVSPPSVVHERFDGAWRSIYGGFEPGHQLEWAWLLTEYGALAAEDMTPWTARLHVAGFDHGRSGSGLLFDRVGDDLAADTTTFRLWPQCEAIKAAMQRGDATKAAAMAALLRRNFLGRPFAAGWIDRIDAADAPLVDHVPASSLYHLMFAAAELANAGRAA